MSTANNSEQSKVFLAGCIDYLMAHDERVRKAIGALRALMDSVDQFDYEQLQVMAKALIDRSLNPHFMSPSSSLTQPPPISPDDDLPFDPSSPTREPNEREAHIFQKLVGYLFVAKNRPSSAMSLAGYAKASREELAAVLNTTHRDKFERLRINNLPRWRLRPEVFADLANTPKADQPVASATGNKSLFPHPASQMTQTEAAAEVLRQTKRPLPTNEIVRRIIDGGLYHIEGELKQFTNSVYTAMARKAAAGDTFVKVSRGTWGLTEWTGGGGE